MQFLAAQRRPALIAMIHVGALPGTPRAAEPVIDLCRQAVAEAALLTRCGVDAIMLENMHDVPYLNRRVGPEITAAMTAISLAVRGETALPLGIQVLAGANRAALAIAHAAGLQFIRSEGFVFAHVADEGLMPAADAGRLLRYRRAIGAMPIAILADIKKKHAAHALTADISVAESAAAAEFFGADGVVVTGTATGREADVADARAVREATRLPAFIGSGITPGNLSRFAPHCRGLIVGSWYKHDGQWQNGPDESRVRQLVETVAATSTAP